MGRVLEIVLVEHAAVTLAVVLGAAAVYLLRPRPRPYPWLLGAGLAAAALLAAGFGVVRAFALTPETVLFCAFAAIAVVSGGLLVTQHNPARAALSFALVVLSTCGLFLLLAAPFLMAATTIIYAGAIVVTFLFVLMLAQQEGASSADQRSREPLLATVAGFLLLAALVYVLQASYTAPSLDELDRQADELLARLDAAGKDQEDDGALEDWKRLMDEYEKEGEKHAALPQGAELHDAASNAKQLAVEPAEMRESLGRVKEIGARLRANLGWLQPPGADPLSEASGPAPHRPPADLRRDPEGRPQLPAQNTAYLGRALFSDYLLA